MLDPWIIEEIRRREEDRRREQEERRVEIPLESPQYQDNGAPATPAEEPERGVVVIDM
ncbi:MAG TPA: hypothetical protein VMZ28_26870 [Kofleriaceae bacterium]|jgi:hypothetical protein|nr:hypothetical protein [Kofleriaceae bacterium]